MMKKLSYKDYNKRITNRDSGNVQSHDQEENKLNSSIKLENGPKKHVQNVARIKYGFVELVVILFLLIQGESYA